jgi:hypothetical protein
MTTPPFVISTGAQRSGEISVWMLFPGNVFSQKSALYKFLVVDHELGISTCPQFVEIHT